MSEFYINVEKTDENTLLLVHGWDISDASGFAREIVNHGVTVSTEHSKFGDRSMYFDGVGSRLQIPNLIQGNMPFTVECWVMPLSIKNNTIWSHGGTNTPEGTGGGVEAYGAGTFIYYCNGFWIQGSSYQTKQWYHIALVGEQNTIKLYVNGSLIGQHDGVYDFGNYVEDIGANASVYGGENFHGYIDEIRISNVARWTGDFTPPTERYTTKLPVQGLTIAEGVVTQIADAAGRVLWKAGGGTVTISMERAGSSANTPYNDLYLVYNGVEYRTPDVFKAKIGETITCVCTNTSAAVVLIYVYDKNGNQKAYGDSDKPPFGTAQADYVIEGNATVTLERNDLGPYDYMLTVYIRES